MFMLFRFLLGRILFFCAFFAGFFLFMPTIFAVNETESSYTECNYLRSYISVYGNNNPVEILKLQIFLNEYEDLNVKLNGVFDSSTIIAVRKFQEKYSNDILSPWGLNKPTGNVSITTRHKINNLFCGTNRLFSEKEKETISDIMKQSPESMNLNNDGSDSAIFPGIPQSNLKNSNVKTGIPVGFISKFSLPILIALAVLLAVQLYFFWKIPTGHKS